jgi:hypothetical protein
MHCPVKKIDILTEFPSAIIDARESKFIMKVPGRGAVALDVFTKISGDE